MRIAVTGSIGSGKSTLMEIIKSLGFDTLSCDEIAHDLEAKGQKGYLAITQTFTDVLDSEMNLDRQKLAKRVFNDSKELNKLNGLMHPLIREELLKRMSQCSLVFVEVPLLFEAHFEDMFDYSILVYAKEEMVKERLKDRGLNDDEISKRLASQMDVAKKKELADYSINNSSDKTALKSALIEILKEVGICLDATNIA